MIIEIYGSKVNVHAKAILDQILDTDNFKRKKKGDNIPIPNIFINKVGIKLIDFDTAVVFFRILH
jgi:hypothetical protein